MWSPRITLALPFLAGLTGLAAAWGDESSPTAADAAATASHAPAISAAFVPSVRELDAGELASGAEPDPESFDRAGLEAWWRHYRETVAMRADNAHR